jgi:ATP-dependent Lon protease
MTKTPNDKDNKNNKINTRSTYKKRKLKLLELDDNPTNNQSKRSKIEYNIIINNPILSYVLDENMKEKIEFDLNPKNKKENKKENTKNNISLDIDYKKQDKNSEKIEKFEKLDKFEKFDKLQKEISNNLNLPFEKKDKSIEMLIRPVLKTESNNLINKNKESNDLIKKIYKFKNDNSLKYYLSLSKSERNELNLKQKEVNEYFNKDIPIRFKILESNIDMKSKVFILNKLDNFENMARFDSEYGKLKNWFDNISRIPFNNYVDIPIKMSDPIDKIQNFINDIKIKLDKTIYGQEKAKDKLLQIIAQWISNPKSKCSYIALEGPPGVGKTSLIKNGVSKSFNRPFNFIALGGATDSSFLEGHSYTYEGATYGKIIEILIQSKVMNPIIFFDELDKISMTFKGEEINGILTHLTDTTQNNCFNDKFFTGIDFDLSRSMLFFSYNDIEKINPILKDRLTIIKFESYKVKDKINIAMKYLIPELMDNINMNYDELIFNEKIIEYIIEKYTANEKGVRNLKRSLEEILMKVNLMKLISINREKENNKLSETNPNKESIKVINSDNLFSDNNELLIKEKEKENINKMYNIKDFKLPLVLTVDIVNNLLKEFEKPELSFSVQRMYL